MIDKIVCLGKNYLDHAKELGDAVPEKPVLFLKPPSSILQASSNSSLQAKLPPTQHGSVHHECEIVLRMNSYGEITHVTLGLDLTLRELQAQLKKNGHPWEISKVFKHSTILGSWIPISDFPDYLKTPFSFSLNGKVKQSSVGTKMRYSPQKCITYISEYFPICDGDLVMTGTPEGVGPIQAGDLGTFQWGDQLECSVLWSGSSVY